MKPYRLINTSELQQFATHFARVLEDWNQLYSLHPLTIDVSLPTKEYCTISSWCIENAQGQLLACIPNDSYQFINYALFGVDHEEFNSCSDQLLLLLLSQILETDSCSFNKIKQEVNWLYPGSTCLLLNLSCNASRISIALNPDWVYQNLSIKPKHTSLTPLEETLAEKPLTLNLELCSMNIPIKQLMELQIGDVIATDHPHNSPMRLLYDKKHFASAELGKTLDNKSVIIKEFL